MAGRRNTKLSEHYLPATDPNVPTSLQEIRRAAGKLAKRWEGTTQENANTQVFWTEFFSVFGIDSKRVVLFERHAERLSTGNRGRIDVFWPGELLVEQKSLGRSLTKATEQAYDYLDGLAGNEVPSLVIVSDFEKFEVHDLTVSPPAVTRFTLKQLPERISLFTWMAGYTRRPSVKIDDVAANAKAVKKMASLYDALSQESLSDHFTSVFLTRILFLLFGEDTGLMERGLFAQTIRDRSNADGSDLGGLLADLFQVLDQDPKDRSERTDEMLLRFPYVNGSVFSEPIPLTHFDQGMREALLSASDFDWGQISPAVFGSMFQAVKSKEARRELGEHYTTERDILRTVGPLFLDELKQEFQDSQFSVQKLNELWNQIGGLKFLDPACGCGNFLVITYRELRELELQIMERLQQLTGQLQTSLVDEDLGLKVSLAQFHGIEIEEWPAKIAEVALFITDHQANRRMMETVGVAPERLPLKVSAKVVRENALTADWGWVLQPSDDLVILGNPPFVGISLRTEQQTADLQHVWGKGYHGSLDLVTAWYKKAADYVGDHTARIAFVSTSSICQGEQVAPLWGPLIDRGFIINFAHQTFAWKSEATGAAAVHVVIVGFSQRASKKTTLFHYPDVKGEPESSAAKNISPYLIEGPTVVVRPRTHPLSPSITEVRYGNKPTDGGGLLIEAAEYADFAADPVAIKYVQPFVGARELLHDEPRWCLWLVDLDPTDYKSSRLLRERIEKVRVFREASKAASTRAAATTARLFRQISQPDTAYLGIPRHFSENREYLTTKRFSAEVIVGDANFLADDPDGLLFAVISSSAFITWQRAVGGKLESRPRFSKLGVWNTFPLPTLSEAHKERLVDAGQAVLAARDLTPGRSLADMYEPNAMTVPLIKAHQNLDSAMDAALVGRKKLADNAARMAALFDLYVEMAP